MKLVEPVDYVARCPWGRLVLLCAALGAPASETARAIRVGLARVRNAVARRGGQPRSAPPSLSYDEHERLMAWLGIVWRSARAQQGETVEDWTQALMCAVACGVDAGAIASRLVHVEDQPEVKDRAAAPAPMDAVTRQGASRETHPAPLNVNRRGAG